MTWALINTFLHFYPKPIVEPSSEDTYGPHLIPDFEELE